MSRSSSGHTTRVMCPLLPCDSVILHDMAPPSHSRAPTSPTLQPTLHATPRRGRSPQPQARADTRSTPTDPDRHRPSPIVSYRMHSSPGQQRAHNSRCGDERTDTQYTWHLSPCDDEERGFWIKESVLFGTLVPLVPGFLKPP